MEMSIDEVIYLIEHHKPNDVNNAYELGEAFCVAISTMHKYQYIQEIYKSWRTGDYKGSTECMEEIGEVLKDGNDD